MPEHKMVTIGGVRYRSEDAHKAPRTRRERVPSTEPVRETRQVEVEGAPFDPTAHNVDEVLAYLKDAEPEEAERVYEAEAAGKSRTTVLNTRETGTGSGSEEGDGDDGDSSGAAG
ncbi:hypothetical protein [Streptomonospora salina]|uniref:hypothetical protein n=1 Tax=Streptomonospora salina TaxID=104205 RepID=UPI0031EF965F